MMSAPSVPMAQGMMPAGFAAFLANIGQVPAGDGESTGFGELLAAAPSVPAASMKIEPPAPADVSAPQPESAEPAVAVEAPVVKPEPTDINAAAALAATLLIALNGGVASDTPASGKPVPAGSEAEAALDTADAVENAVNAPTANWMAVVTAAILAAARPAKSVETSAAPADDSAPAPSFAARPRDAALPMPLLAGTEAPTAKPIEAAPSMTILFTQVQTQGAATLADAAPALVAERTLDIDSDGAWIDQLARDIAATKSDSGDISFRLMPRHLGRLDVAMQMGDEGMSLKMDTRHEATAVIVTAAQGRLVDELRQQGVRVLGAEVTCTPGETGRQSQNQGQGRAAAHDPAHLIETAAERVAARDEDRADGRRGRFA